MCEFDKAIETYRRSGFYLDAAAMAALGREEHAAQLLAGRRELAAKMGGAVARLMQSLASYLARDTGGSLAALEAALETAGSDPEALYYAARQMARAGEAERAVSILSEVVQRGFWCSHGMRLDPWLTPLSGRADFAAVLERSLSLEQDARQAFLSAGGSRILG
jgi:thioredoxin-like negative regulator of GroEL